MIYRFTETKGNGMTMYQILRIASAGLATLVGAALIGRLWLVALDAVSLGNAVHGLVFLLLALGLIGYQRLSLALTALACTPVFFTGATMDSAGVAAMGQYALFSLCLVLFVIHPRYRKRDEA
jgi:hypothetical protein